MVNKIHFVSSLFCVSYRRSVGSCLRVQSGIYGQKKQERVCIDLCLTSSYSRSCIFNFPTGTMAVMRLLYYWVVQNAVLGSQEPLLFCPAIDKT